MSKERFERRLRFGPADREEAYYRYVAFEVPAAWPSLHVELSFDRSVATVDLGLLGPGGFRGWSGGARSTVTVAPSWATPGYLPGELAGEWSAILGLYQVPPRGVEVVLIAQRAEPPEPALVTPPDVPRDVPRLQRPPARPGYRWVAGDLHCHSEHSDGALSLAGLAAFARSRGLDFLAITDHNTVSHFAHLERLSARYGLSILPGQEVTTPVGHANVFGQVGWVDFRSPPSTWVKQAQQGAGLLSINHPVVPVLGWQMELDVPPPLVELWHQSWDRRQAAPFEFWASLPASPAAAANAAPTAHKNKLRRHWGDGRRRRLAATGPVALYYDRPVPVGGSDFHRHEETDGTGAPRLLGNPTTWVEVPASKWPPATAEIIAGLTRGAVALGASPLGPTVVRLGDEWVVTGGEGATLAWLAGPPWSPHEAKQIGVGCEDTSSFAASPDEPGIAVLLDRSRRVLALCA